MSIISTDLKYYKSTATGVGGGGSLGGAITATELSSGTIDDLFDSVTGDEADAGSIEYRCVYIKNTNGLTTLRLPKIYIKTNTPSANTSVEVGLGTAAVGGEEQTIANESAAPVGVTFSLADGQSNGLVFADLPPGQYKSLWVKRIVTAGARAYDNDTFTLSTIGLTT